MGEKGYDNPNVDGSRPGVGAHGEPTAPKSSGLGAAKSSGYDNTPNSTKARTDGTTAKPAGGGGSKSGYDDIKKDQDFGFKGTPKNRSSKI